MNNNSASNAPPAPVVGYRFHPTDEELIVNYLEPKVVRDDNYQNFIIGIVDICKFEPGDLPSRSKIQSRDPVWYFYCVGEKKFAKSKQAKRTTKEGYWKSTGKPRLIKSKRTKKVIGTKRSLVYHLGRPKGNITEWVMHEYKCISDSSVTKQQENIVLCKLKKKSRKKYEKDETNHHNISMGLAFDYENQESDEMRSLTSMPSQNMNFDSTNQSILETTTASDLACDGSNVSFHVTFPAHILSPGGMTTNTAQEIGVSNLEIPNMDKQDSTSATSSASFGIQQEKVDNSSIVDGLMAFDLSFPLDIDEADNMWVWVPSMLEQEDIANIDPEIPLL